MTRETAAKVIWGGFIAALGVVLGLATAPLLVPALEKLIFHDGGNADLAIASFFGGAGAGGWQGYLATTASTLEGFCLLALWCAVAIAILGAYVAWNEYGKKGRMVRNGVLGDSRLISSTRELRRKNDFWDGKGAPEKAGLVISGSKKGYLFDSSVPHWAVVGRTGSGKSQLMVLETLHSCMAAAWNLIITGKDELLELTGDTARELGYHRVVFDLKGYPAASHFNPLDLIVEFAGDGQIDLAQRTARQTAADLIPLGGEANTYFPKAARSALTACLLIVALADIPKSQKNMATVCRLVNLGTTGDGKDPSAPLKDYIRSDEVGPAHPAYAPAADFLSDGGVTTAGKNVLSTLKETLSIFNDEGIRSMTAYSDHSILSMIQEKTAVYMHLLEEGDPYQVVMTVFLNQWWRVAQQQAAKNGGRLPHETAIVGDEWGNLPMVAALPEIVTLGRSYKLHMYAFTQDLKQWHKYNKPGDQNAGRDKILGSMGGKVALSLANPDDFDYFTRLAGKHTVRTQNMGTSRQGCGIGAMGGSSENYAERADDLIHTWEWRNRVPVRDGLIAIKGGENAKPGREGVFEMPVTYASNTPAGAFFGLGTECENDEKRRRFRREMEATASSAEPVATWVPDFEACKSATTAQEQVAGDEWSAWD